MPWRSSRTHHRRIQRFDASPSPEQRASPWSPPTWCPDRGHYDESSWSVRFAPSFVHVVRSSGSSRSCPNLISAVADSFFSWPIDKGG